VSDAASFSASDSLKSHLSKISTVRPEQVAKAKKLLSDENYPSDDELERVAGLLADHLTGQSEGTPQKG